jgi:uncharacterized protein
VFHRDDHRNPHDVTRRYNDEPTDNRDLARGKGPGSGEAVLQRGSWLPDREGLPRLCFFHLGGDSSALALYTWDALAEDAGVASDGSGFRGVTLNYVVPSAERVDEVLAEAERVGGKIVKPAQQAQWGYFGYFSDLDGHLWKVASE